MTDDDLPGYFAIHSRTDVCLFNRVHVARMYELAGLGVPTWIAGREWWTVDPEDADYLIQRINQRKKVPVTNDQKLDACKKLICVFHGLRDDMDFHHKITYNSRHLPASRWQTTLGANDRVYAAGEGTTADAAVNGMLESLVKHATTLLESRDQDIKRLRESSTKITDVLGEVRLET